MLGKLYKPELQPQLWRDPLKITQSLMSWDGKAKMENFKRQ